MSPGIVIDPAVGKFGDATFARPHRRKRLAGQPGLAAIVAVDGRVETPGVILPAVTGRSEVTRWSQESPLVFPALQLDAMLRHVQRRRTPLRVRFDDRQLLRPCPPIVAAAIHRLLRRGFGPDHLLHKDENIAAGFVHGRTAGIPSGVGDGDRLAPSLAGIFTAAHLDSLVPPFLLLSVIGPVDHENRAPAGHQHIGQTTGFEQRLDLKPRFTTKRVDWFLDRLSGCEK